MKNLSILLLFVISFTQAIAQKWTWSSDNPIAGSDLVVKVSGIDIEENIHIIGYYFKGDELVTSDINYIVEDGGLKMTLKAPETNWLRIVIKDENFQPV